MEKRTEERDKKIAVVIVNYNGIADTLECIDSLKRSDNFKDISIIVVDNNSNNNEAERIREGYNFVTVISSNSNKGFAGGNNLGIKYALKNGFQYVLLLNNDTVIAHDMISILASNCLNKEIVVPIMYYFSNPDFIWYGGGTIDKHKGNGIHLHSNEKDMGKLKANVCTFSTGCCMLIPSIIFEEIGLLDEKSFMYCEDMEFCIRLDLNNIKIKFLPEAKLWHKVGVASGGESSPFSTYYLTRNRLNYVRQYRNYFAITAYPFSLLSRIIRMIFNKDPEVRKAFYFAIYDHLHKIYKSRY